MSKKVTKIAEVVEEKKGKKVGHIQDTSKIHGKSFEMMFHAISSQDHSENVTLLDFVYNLQHLAELQVSYDLNDRDTYADTIHIINNANLSKKMRLALLHRFVHHLSKKECSQKLGISTGTLDRLLIRALALIDETIHKKKED